MASGLLIFPGAQPSRSRSGGIISAELRFYVNETTTPAVVYTDAALTIPHAWPILSDDAGRFDLIWADTSDFFSCNWTTAAPDSQSVSFDGLSTTNAADVELLDSMNAVLSDAMDLYESLAEVDAAVDLAQAFAAQAAEAVSGTPGTNATSTTSLAIGVGTKALSVETGKLFVPGQTVALASAASPSNQMSGIVQSYDLGTGAMSVSVNSLLGAGTFAAWSISLSALASGLPPIRSARTANTVLGASDNGGFIDVTSGTFSQTFLDAASLGSGWRVLYRNSGTGDITLTPTGGQLIDGLLSYVMYPNEARWIISDGASAFYTVVVQPFSKSFTASGTFTKPPGYISFGYRARSGGASGGRGSTNARGGGGGGCWEGIVDAALLGASEAITIGAGGAARTTDGNPNPGGDTSLGTVIVVPGAPSADGGGVGSTGSAAYLGGAVSGATPTDAAYGGGASSTAGNASSGSLYGGGAGGNVDNTGALTGAPGDSRFAGDGGAASSAGSGLAGSIPSGGGGGTRTGTQSGAGARGELKIWGAV